MMKTRDMNRGPEVVSVTVKYGKEIRKEAGRGDMDSKRWIMVVRG